MMNRFEITESPKVPLFTWEKVKKESPRTSTGSDISVKYWIAPSDIGKKKPNLQFIITERIAHHLKIDAGDRIEVFVAKEDPKQLLVHKATEGAKVYLSGKKYMFSTSAAIPGLDLFKNTPCRFILNRGNSVHVILD